MQGIFGVGGERRGTLRLVIDKADGTVTAADIKPEDKDKILVGGGLLTLDALKKAVEVGVAGIVVGGVDSGDLMEFMGTDVGVAITGEEDYGLTLIVTEGFGKMAMHMKTHSIFKEHDGKRASINQSMDQHRSEPESSDLKLLFLTVRKIPLRVKMHLS